MPLDVLIPLTLGLVTMTLVFGATTTKTMEENVARNTAELAALTAPENLDMQVQQWLRENPPPLTPTIPEHIKQLQGRVFSDYVTTIAYPPIDPQANAQQYGADNTRAYELMHAEALNRAKIAAALNAQAEANVELSKALRKALRNTIT